MRAAIIKCPEPFVLHRRPVLSDSCRREVLARESSRNGTAVEDRDNILTRRLREQCLHTRSSSYILQTENRPVVLTLSVTRGPHFFQTEPLFVRSLGHFAQSQSVAVQRTLVVEDAVTVPPRVRFYAGIPFASSEGFVVGPLRHGSRSASSFG